MRPPSQLARNARTSAAARRGTAPWTAEEDVELATCATDDELEAFALRWSRSFSAVMQRRRWPRVQRRDQVGVSLSLLLRRRYRLGFASMYGQRRG